jgi:hypothetical protein
MLSHAVVYEWIEILKMAILTLTDTESSGHPTIAATVENEERAMELSFQNRRQTEEWQLTKRQNNWMSVIGSAYSVVHDNLQFHKVCAK